MMAAVMFGRSEAIQILGEALAQIWLQDADGFTAVDLAVLEGRQNIVQMLVDLEALEAKRDEVQVAEVMERRRNSGGFRNLMRTKPEELNLMPDTPSSQA